MEPIVLSGRCRGIPAGPVTILISMGPQNTGGLVAASPSQPIIVVEEIADDFLIESV